MRKRIAVLTVAAFLVAATVAVADGTFNGVQPKSFDPANTDLVHSSWEVGIGCPTGADVATYPATTPTGNYTDPACPTGDPKDKQTDGLLMVKTGPESNNASATADLKGVKGITLTELGYDIRKSPMNPNEGSHCGAGSPRFEVTTTDGTWDVGCTSPPPDSTTPGDQWERLRWGSGGTVSGFESSNGFAFGPITGTVESIQIVFDESTPGSFGSPDGEGVAILDNIDVNGTLVGRGGG